MGNSHFHVGLIQRLLETFSFLILQSMTLHASAGVVGSLSLSGHTWQAMACASWSSFHWITHPHVQHSSMGSHKPSDPGAA